MAITKPSKLSKVDAFVTAAPDARPARKLRGRRQPLALTLPPELIDELDVVAAEDKRSRANMIEILLSEGIAERRARKATAA